ncbi:hypothetical protein Btru_058278 [Bulinus truncatus]|nr:hypothetical protein Btru_058278 [Bulinus truncatus]
MKLFLISVCLLIVVDSVSSGACVVTCDRDGLISACQPGTECRSNGCGQTCQPILGKRADCPPVLCKMYCELGFALGADGCQICSCVQPE